MDSIKDFLGVGMTSGLDWIEYEEAIESSIKIILGTSKGERVMRPTFGSGLKHMVLSSVDSVSINNIKAEIKNSIKNWEPRVKDVEVTIDDLSSLNQGMLNINIAYIIISSNKKANMVYPFYTQGVQ